MASIMDSHGNGSEYADIVARLKVALPVIQAKYGVSKLSMFGSSVRGEMEAASDIDLLVEFDLVPGFFKFVELEDELGGLLGRKVDLVMKQALRPRIGRRVLAEAVPV